MNSSRRKLAVFTTEDEMVETCNCIFQVELLAPCGVD